MEESELIARTARSLQLSEAQTREVFHALLLAIADELAQGHTVVIEKFGSFERQGSPAHPRICFTAEGAPAAVFRSKR